VSIRVQEGAVGQPEVATELNAAAENEQIFRDRYTGGQVLADQTGAAAVLTFTFSNPMDLVWIRSDGGDSRADPFGGTPSASLGIICEDGIPTPLTVRATTVKVYAPVGATVNAVGYRYT
jgi:hypothetical protein